MRYLRIYADGCHGGCGFNVYIKLDPLTSYGEKDLTEIAQETFNEHFGNWSQEVLLEEDVPVGER